MALSIARSTQNAPGVFDMRMTKLGFMRGVVKCDSKCAIQRLGAVHEGCQEIHVVGTILVPHADARRAVHDTCEARLE